MDFSDLIQHLTSAHNDDMLDRTKCSITARNIYNYLTSWLDGIKSNDNMTSVLPNIQDIENVIMSETGDRVYFVHFHHITDETSHFFIIYQHGQEHITSLQSAVFEFSLHDWVYPILNIVPLPCNSMHSMHSMHSMEEPSVYENILAEVTKDRVERDNVQAAAIFRKLQECEFSRGTSMDSSTFIERFIKPLKTLESDWTESNLSDKIAAYKTVFACELSFDKLRKMIFMEGGVINGTLKYISSPMNVHCKT